MLAGKAASLTGSHAGGCLAGPQLGPNPLPRSFSHPPEVWECLLAWQEGGFAGTKVLARELLSGLGSLFFVFFCWGGLHGELSTLRQTLKVPNEPGLSPSNGLENAFLSDQSVASNARGANKSYWRQDDQPLG